MTAAHIPAVIALERAAYGDQRPNNNYEDDLQKNKLAHYYVLHDASQSNAIGHGGFWLLADQLHISTLAIHPDWRRTGLGSWLLLSLIEKGQALGADNVTLEVRASNHGAIALYRQFCFQEVGRRPRYYRDGEDALILTTPQLASAEVQTVLSQKKTALRKRLDKISHLD